MSDEPLPRFGAMRRSPCNFVPISDAIKLITMKVSKRLEIPVVALPRVGYMPAACEHGQAEARVLCVAVTRQQKGWLLVWLQAKGLGNG